MTTRSDQALYIAHEMARRLEDVECVADRQRRAANLGGGQREGSEWMPHFLSCGYPGTALLFAELSEGCDAFRVAARKHLAAGVAASNSAPPAAGVFTGLAGLGFAARAVAAGSQDCSRLIAQCDDFVGRAARETLSLLEKNPGALRTAHFDAVTGLSGVARYLLRARGPVDPLVREITRFLIGLCLPAAGADVPRWFTKDSYGVPAEDGDPSDGQLNLGLAHGIGGVLAYLSVARLHDVRLPLLQEAISHIAAWYLKWYKRASHGANWPSVVSYGEEVGGLIARSGDRGAWCYGTPGIARTLQSAARATGDGTLAATARRAMGDFVAQILEGGGMNHPALCHGWAGLLRITQLMNDEAGTFDDALDEIAVRVIDAFEPHLPLGFAYNTLDPDHWADAPGLLDGAAGTALALLAYAGPGASRTGWEEVFLLC